MAEMTERLVSEAQDGRSERPPKRTPVHTGGSSPPNPVLTSATP